MVEMGTWISLIKAVTTVGEIAKFPYVGGVATCVIMLLENIQATAQNDEDLREIADSIRTTMDSVVETLRTHGTTSAPLFRDVCTELKIYLESLLAELNRTQRNARSLKRFFKTKNVSDAIAGFKGRAQKIKEDFMIRVTTDSRLAIADLEGELNTSTATMIDAIETSKRDVQEEIRSLRVVQNKKMDTILSSIVNSQSRYSYKRQIRVVMVGDIQLLEVLDNPSISWSVDNRTPSGYRDYSAAVVNISVHKVVRVYSRQSEAAIAKCHSDLQAFIQLRHPNVIQIFGICESPHFLAIIFHEATRTRVTHYVEGLTALELLEFHVQLFRDLKSVSQYLYDAYETSSLGWDECMHSYSDTNGVYINHRGRVVLASLSTRYVISGFDMSYSSSGHTVQLLGSDGDVPEISNLISQILPTKEFQKDDLLGIYDSLYYFTPSSTTFTCPQSSHSTFPPGSVFLHSRDASNYLVGDIMVDVKIWIMEEIIDNEFESSTRLSDNQIAQIALPALLGDSVLQIRFTCENIGQIIYSWFAQASRLKSAVDFEEGSVFLQLDLHYELEITPTKNPFQLSDTFMAEDLPPGPPSLSLTPPRLDSHTRNILWPSFILLSDSSEISFEDVEAIFGVDIRTTLKPTKYQLAEKQLFNIPELHAACRFNPALMGSDVCKYFGLPLLRVYDKPMRVSEHNPSARSIWEGSSMASIPEHLKPGITDSYEKVKAARQTMPCHDHDRNESLNYHAMRVTASNKKALIKALVFRTIHLLLQRFAKWLGHCSSQSKRFTKFRWLVLAHRYLHGTDCYRMSRLPGVLSRTPCADIV